MKTITIWLLISLGSNVNTNSRPTQVVERFATVQECQRIVEVLSGWGRNGMHQCVQATVVREAKE